MVGAMARDKRASASVSDGAQAWKAPAEQPASGEAYAAAGEVSRRPQLEIDQTALLVPVGAIVLGTNARQHWDVLDDRLERLAASIQEQGILEPLIVRELSGRSASAGRRFELVAGFRRYAAAQRLKLPRVPVRVVALSDDEALAANLAENLARQDLPEEEAIRAVESLQETYRWGVRRIARATGRSVGWISELLTVARNRPEREAVESRKLALSTAFRLARLRRGFPELHAELLERVQSGQTLQLDDVPRVRQLQPLRPVDAAEAEGESGAPPGGDAPEAALDADEPAEGEAEAAPATPWPGLVSREREAPAAGGAEVLRLGAPELALARNVRLVVRQVLGTLHGTWVDQGLDRRLPADLREDLRVTAEEIARFLNQELAPPPKRSGA